MDVAPGPLLLLLSMLLLLRQQAGALRLNVTVPAYVRRGESAHLMCRYDMESQKQYYSVSWYKDNEHIYTFSKKHNKQQVFGADGVRIDTHRSNDRDLQLQSVSLNSTGRYACEVSTDSRPFKVVRDEAYMEVIEEPRRNPNITVEERIYASGDILALNCTSGASYPAAQLQWFVNDHPVDPDTEVLHLISHGLHITHSSLRLELNPLHLSEGTIRVKCESVVQTSPRVQRQPYLNIRDTSILVRGHSSLSTPSLSLLLAALFLLSLLRKD